MFSDSPVQCRIGPQQALAKKKWKDRLAIWHGNKLVLCKQASSAVVAGDTESHTFLLSDFAEVVSRVEDGINYICINMHTAGTAVHLTVGQTQLYSLW